MGCSGSSEPKAATAAPTAPGNGSPAPGDKSRDKQQAKEENKEYQAMMKFLAQVALFKRLPKDQHPLLAAACVPQDFAPGQSVIRQGELGSEFFIIRSGEAQVLVQSETGAEPVKVAVLKLGDYFGENALLRNEPRTATIQATTALSTLKITREKFKELGLNDKLQFANRKAVGGGGHRQLQVRSPSEKTTEEKKLIAEALRTNENLQTMIALDEARVEQLINVCWKERVPAGKELITEGDLVADYFYVVQDGSFEIFVSDQEEKSQDPKPQSAERAVTRGESRYVSTISKGGSFGELALLYLVPRAATVKAKVDSIVWVIDRNNFKNILMKVSDEKITEYVKYLDRVEILTSLLTEEKRAIAAAMVDMHFTKDEVILQQGEPGNTFFILYDGEVSVVKDGIEQVKLIASMSRQTAQYFGERALLNNEPRAATVIVTSSTAKAMALDRDAFNLLLGPLEDIIKRQEEAKRVAGGRPSMINKTTSSGKHLVPELQDRAREKILRKDLTKIGLLGCGGFGAVELWEHKVTNNTYAMKALSKGYIVKTGMQDSVINEKNILMMTNSVFIIRLYETYNGSQTLYFLMEPALGGELYATYNRKGFHGSEKHAKYYCGGVVFAFEHLHERRIIYRDLKPENLLLNEKGHLKVTDMGLAKFVIGKTYTTCGTPDYFAPELIASTGHTNAVDWWMLGILVFELLTGHPPFESAYPMQIYSKVMKGIGKVPFPPILQGPPGDLIKALLQKEPSERLPMRPGGTKNLKEHKWFSGFDWEGLKDLTLEAPYKPVVKSKKDLANFSARKEDMPRQIEHVDDGSGWDKEFASA